MRNDAIITKTFLFLVKWVGKSIPDNNMRGACLENHSRETHEKK